MSKTTLVTQQVQLQEWFQMMQWRFCLARAIIPVLSEPVFRLTLIHFDFA